MNTLLETPVKLTTGALAEVKRLQAEPDYDTANTLRIGVKGGGCSGLSYVLGFDKATANDNEYETDGVRFVIDKAHELYLAGMEIEWENGLNNRGFSFKKPECVQHLRVRDEFCGVDKFTFNYSVVEPATP